MLEKRITLRAGAVLVVGRNGARERFCSVFFWGGAFRNPLFKSSEIAPPVVPQFAQFGVIVLPQESFMRAAGKTLIVGAVLAVLVCVWASQAFPQTLRLARPLVRVPYTVDSVFVRHPDGGSPSIDMYTTSYSHNGREIQLSSSLPGHPFATAIRRTLDATGFVLFQLRVIFHSDAEEAERDANAVRVRNGCVNGPVVGQETILDYPTVAIEYITAINRTTVWMSPDLGCFPLRMTYDERRPDSTFRQVIERHTLKVTPNL
jgi:hypothetical protein